MAGLRLAVMMLGAATALEAQGPPAAAPAAPPPQPSITLPVPLDRVLRDYERAWAAGDTAALASLFTPDGFVPTRFGWVRGSAAIKSTYGNASGALRLRAHAYATGDSVGYIIGAYRYATIPDTSTVDGGKFVLALRRGPDGRWLIAADLDGPNRR